MRPAFPYTPLAFLNVDHCIIGFFSYHKESSSEEEEEDDGDMVELGKGFSLYKGLYDKLYDHQKAGILFLWKLHRSQTGGILADDMGLGKTIQIIGFLAGLFDMEKVAQRICKIH